MMRRDGLHSVIAGSRAMNLQKTSPGRDAPTVEDDPLQAMRSAVANERAIPLLPPGGQVTTGAIPVTRAGGLPLRVLMAGIAVGPAFLVFAAFYQLANLACRHISETLEAEFLRGTSKAIQATIQRDFDAATRLCDRYVQRVAMGVLPTRGLSAWESFMTQDLTTTPEVASIAFGAADGDSTWLLRHGERLELGRGRGAPDGRAIELPVSLDGRTIGTAPLRTYDYDPRKRPWYEVGLKSKGPAWTSVYFWFGERGSDAELGVGVARAISSSSGEFLGVVVVDLTLEGLSVSLRELAKTAGVASLAIVDEQGLLVATSRGRVTNDAGVRQGAAALGPGLGGVAEQLFADAKAEGGEASTTCLDAEARPCRARVSALGLPAGPHWSLLTVVPEGAFFQETDETRHRMLLAGIPILVGAAFFGLVLGQRLVRPVVAIADHARAVARGKTDEHLDPTGPRELRELSQEITRMSRAVSQRDALRTSLADAAERQSALVSKLQQSETRYRVLNEQLEERIADRTARLQAANHELEAFTYTVTHDLRAPLRHVFGFGQLLQRDLGDGLPPKAQRHLETMLRATRQMGTIIDGLLAFSRLGRASIVRTHVFTAKLVDELIEQLNATHPDRTIEWKKGDLPEVTGDATLLRQVFANLLDNAVKYSSKKPRSVISISGRVMGRDTEFEVTDNGAGFDPRYQDKLFGVFQRLHSVAEFEGVGIGLATVRRIVERHGGRIWAHGRPGEGAEFFFTIPREEPTP